MSNDPTTLTALSLITGALRKTGQYAAGEPIAAADLNDALDVLNGHLDAMSLENKMIFNSVENIVNLVPGQNSYTVGVGGNFNIQRPLRITNAYSRVITSSSTVDFFCDIKDRSAYAQIGLKAQPGPWPKFLYYNPVFPLATMLMWPTPSQAVEFHFWTDMLLQSLSLTTVLNLPQGYYIYLQFALAELLCVEYGVPISPDVARFVRKYEKMIKDNNSVVDQLASIDQAIVTNNNNDAGWILTGGF